MFDLNCRSENVTVEEVIQYGNDRQIKDKLVAIYDDQTKDIATIKELQNEIELMDEQLYFAKETLHLVEFELECATKMREFKKTFSLILENSEFKR